MPRPTKILTKEDIIRAQKVTRSNMAAARYLHVSYIIIRSMLKCIRMIKVLLY